LLGAKVVKEHPAFLRRVIGLETSIHDQDYVHIVRSWLVRDIAAKNHEAV
jgi:hypothetical protein